MVLLIVKTKTKKEPNMPKYCVQYIKNLLPCEPFSCTGSEIVGTELHLYFSHTGSHEVCPDCGEPLRVHEWRDIRLLAPPSGVHRKVFWHVHYCIYKCENCLRYKTQDIPFRFLHTGCTTELAKLICDDLCNQNGTIKDVAARYALKWDRVKDIHKKFLQVLAERVPKPEGPEIAVVDEFAIEKHHKYATLVIDGKTKLPLYLHKGKGAEDFEPFFSRYSKEFYKNIKAFAMDQNASYESVVSAYLPECAVVCDYFHLVKNYNEQVVDAVRKRTLRKAGLFGDSKLIKALKGSKRLLCKRFKSEIDNEEDWEAKLSLEYLMELNKELDTCIHMREKLQNMYESCRSKKQMRKAWKRWYKMAICSGIAELVQFAKNKNKRRKEIINHAVYPISSGVIEGCMNKIKVIKRATFGLRDFEYFFLRIWIAFYPRHLKERYEEELWHQLGCFDESDIIEEVV